MNQTITGTIGSVTQMVACDVLVADAMTGTTVLQVGDVADFDEAGGHLAIDETVYAYTAIDDDTSTITLAAPLPVDHLTDSVVEVRLAAGDGTSYHRIVEYDVELAPIDGSTPITATLAHALIPLVSADTRGLDGETAEAVRGEHEDAFEVTRIFGREATLNPETVGMPQLQPDVVAEIVSAQEAADQALADAAAAQTAANAAAVNAAAAAELAETAGTVAAAAEAAAAAAQDAADTAATAASTAAGVAAGAVDDAAAAQLTADGKNAVWYDEPPADGHALDDIWFKATANGRELRRWDGTGWAVEPLGETSIADLAITDAKIANLDIGKATAGFLDVARLRGKSISVEKLMIGSTENLIADPTFTITELGATKAWEGVAWAGTMSIATGQGRAGDNALAMTNNGQQRTIYNRPFNIPARAGQRIALTAIARSVGQALPAAAVVIGVRWTSITGVHTWSTVSNSAAADGAWITIQGMSGAAPVDVASATFYIQGQASLTAGTLYIDYVGANLAATGELIVDGAISTIKLQADAVNATRLAADALTVKHTITGSAYQTTATADRGLKINGAGMVGYNPTGQPTLAYDAATGDVSILGTLRAGSKVIGSVFETSEVTNQGLKMGPTGLIGYDLGGVPTLAYDAVAGALTLKGTISSGSTIEGAEFKGAFALLGSLQVGAITIDDADGLNVPGAIHVPANGADAVTLTAHATLKSATVEDNASLYGTTQLFGKLRAASGITPPTAAPTPAYSWPFTGTTDTEFGHIFRGLTDVPAGDKWASAYNFGGLGIQVTNKSDAAKFNWPVTGPSTESFSTGGGIVRLGSNYYILGQDWNRGANWYVYRVDASTFVKNAEWGFGVYADVPKIPAIGTDGSQILIAWSRPNGLLAVAEYSTSGTHARTNCILPAGSTAIDCGGVAMGNFDYGADTLLVATRAGQVYVSNPSSYVNATTPLTRLTTSEWTSANSTAVSGLVWDGTSFRHLDDAARTWQYSANRVTQSIDLAHAWYDGDAGGTGTHETQPGKKTTSSWKARSWLQVSTTPPPDAGNTDPLATDKADRVRVYAGLPAGTLRLQATLAVGVTLTALLSALDVVSKAAETVNGFLSANSAAGQLESTTLDSGGKPKWWFRGDGDYKLPEAPFGSGFNTSALTAVSGTWYNFGSLTNQELRGGMTYAATTGTYTVPRDGLYHVDAQCLWGPSTTAGERALACTAGGVTRYAYEGPSTHCQPKVSFKVRLQAGDTIATQVRQVTGANLALNVSSPGFNYVNVAYIGS